MNLLADQPAISRQSGGRHCVDMMDIENTNKHFLESQLPQAHDQVSGDALAILLRMVQQLRADYRKQRQTHLKLRPGK